ncbi:MAG TPA: papain-like cysteine protease family protein [Pyrinomonadaceae bacterium]|nr:papain-like cysteine protease family protein [Pyrinomonadaceae bacterium]
MTLSEYINATRRPYSSLLREVSIFGKLFVSKQLSFDMEMQTENNWCWAATATSVSHFYWSISTWTQCLVASNELGLTCCDDPVPGACDVPWWLSKALELTKNLVLVTGPATFQSVRDEIDAGRPVGARIGWSGGGGHFMVIYGYSIVGNVNYFDIDDPIYGKSHLSVADFSNSYQITGTWTDTYFTKSYRKMPIKVLIPIEPILRRIWEARPLLELKQGRLAGDQAVELDAAGGASLGMAQRIYSVGLDSLLSERSPAAQPVALRVYEMVVDRPRAFFDVSETREPRVIQMSASSQHLEPLERALGEAVSIAERNDQEAEIRLYRVPALNFEAVWINYEGEERDVLVPLRSVGRLTAHQPVPMEEALAALREAARPLAQMDDKMGA